MCSSDLPKMLQQKNYQTAIVGKWHLGLGLDAINYNQRISPGPNEVGFDYAYIMPDTQDRVPTVYIENGNVVNLDADDPLLVSFKQNFEGEPTGWDNPELLTTKWHHGHYNSIVNGISRIGFMKGGKSAYWSDLDMTDHSLNLDDDPIDKVLDIVPVNDDYSSEKKSTPIYEEIDESVKTFYEFKDFLDSIKLQANYQLVMLKELIEYGENHKGEIAESLAYFNNKDTTDLNTVKYFFNVPVYDVLLNHGFVITTGYKYHRFPIYKLNVQLNESQKIGVLEIIETKLNEYNQLNKIPENEFPNSDNRGSIEWNSENSFEKFKPIIVDENLEKYDDPIVDKILDEI